MQQPITDATPINAMDLRREPGQYLDRVFYRNERFVIQRSGEPKAVIIPLNEYQQMKRIQAEAEERFFAQSDELCKAFSDMSDDEIQALVNEAVAAVRHENRSRS